MDCAFKPLAVVPIVIIVNAGVNNNGVPTGVKVLLVGGALYSCNSTCTLPNNVIAAVALKNPANEVIVPARGATNAKSVTNGLIFIEPPPTDTPTNELPNPNKVPVSANPPRTVTSTAGIPDA